MTAPWTKPGGGPAADVSRGSGQGLSPAPSRPAARFLPVVAALLCAGFAARAAVELPEAYRVIAQRNLFSPSRTPAVTTHAPVAVQAPPPTEAITLTGVVVIAGQPTALFNGSTPGLNGPRRPGERLDIGAIQAVDLGGVTLDAGTGSAPLRLGVGQSLRRVVGQPWAVSAEAAPASAAVGTGAPAAAAGAPPASESADMLQRLLERRKKELGP